MRRKRARGSGSKQPRPREDEEEEVEEEQVEEEVEEEQVEEEVEEQANEPVVPVGTGLEGIQLFTDKERQRFAKLKDRKHVVTKFFHRPTLDKFGLENSVRSLLRKGGMQNFLEVGAPSYPKLTVEFLCSLSRLGNDAIRFRAFGRVYEMSLDQIATAFGWQNRATPEFEPPSDEAIYDFWYNISGRYYRDRNNRSIDISIPAFRLLHRVLACAAYGQGEPAHVSKAEVVLLWCLSPEGDRMPNIVEMWVRRMVQLQGSSSGRLAIGGMVTLLVRSRHIRIPGDLPQAQNGISYDLDPDSLRRMRFITGAKGSDIYHWVCTAPDSVGTFRLQRGHEFDIGDNDTTLDLLNRVRASIVTGLPTIVVEQGEAGEARDPHLVYVDPDEEDVDYEYVSEEENAGQGHSQRVSREEMNTRLGELERRVFERIEYSDEQRDRQFYDLQTQMAALFTSQRAAYGYYSSGGTQWQDPSAAIEADRQRREAERDAWVREQSRRRRNRGPQGPGGSGQ